MVEFLFSIGVSLLFVAAFCGSGAVILTRCGRFHSRVRDFPSLRLLPYGAAMGFALYSYLAALLLLFRMVSVWAVTCLLLAGLLAARRYWIDLVGEVASIRWQEHIRHPLVWLAGFLVLAWAGIATLRSLSPVSEGDAIEGYMVTARWLYQNGFTYCPYNPRYSLFPFQTEQVFALTLCFGTDLICKLIDLWMGFLFVGLVFELARRYSSTVTALLAAGSLATLPIFYNDWTSGKIDNLTSFLLFAGVSLVIFQSRNLPTMVAASFLIGTACAQKYSVWILTLVFLPLVYALRLNGSRLKALYEASVCAVVISLCVLPQLVKNFVWTGNPVAPFATRWIPSQGIFLGHSLDPLSFPWHYWLMFPYTLFFHPEASRGPGPFPIFLLLVCLSVLIWGRKLKTPWNLALTIGLAQMAVWVIVFRKDWLVGRFLLATIALLLVGSAPVFDAFLSRIRGPLQYAVVAGLTLLFLYQGGWVLRYQRDAVRYVFGQQSREKWLAERVEFRGYAATRAMSERLTATERGCVTQSLYYVPMDKLDFICTEQERFELTNTPDDRKADYLRERKIRYILLQGNFKPPWSQNLTLLLQPKYPESGWSWRLYEVPAALGVR